MKRKLSYLDSVHYYGVLWGIITSTVIFVVPFVLCAIFQTLPDWDGLLGGLIGVLPMFWAVGIIEVFTYIPMLGAGSSYLSFVTGNITNLKAPCALECMESAGVKPGSEEGEIISTIATAVSSIVTMLIIAVGVILIIPLSPVLSAPELQPAFANILPALFGALGVVYISKNWKIAIVPVLLMLVLFIAIPALNASTVGIMVPVSALVTIGASRIMYKKGWLRESKSEMAKTTETSEPTETENQGE